MTYALQDKPATRRSSDDFRSAFGWRLRSGLYRGDAVGLAHQPGPSCRMAFLANSSTALLIIAYFVFSDHTYTTFSISLFQAGLDGLCRFIEGLSYGWFLMGLT
ncbi:hypothetical protein J7376_19255 [Paracoccus sp. R12_1]|uniref:hypothetical protein n=1 Tax=unclassified Paracoccus (in: a-proteobacteria) TaxID=2688777 RepID=UPI001ADBA79F|nr:MULTISPECIES: hypothetical protein [unclassified Paracoccus (in: a-proteobacteria)]MBO9457344.1 hypothetical protein [Paracoccus sp. R12_2]MBO9488652.1 hypothetical protein [Paracoccus sp. R12_1]